MPYNEKECQPQILWFVLYRAIKNMMEQWLVCFIYNTWRLSQCNCSALKI